MSKKIRIEKQKLDNKKECKRCKILLPESKFGNWSYAKDGKQVYCKKCWSNICRKNRHKKLYHDCIALITDLEEIAFDNDAVFCELFVLYHLKKQYWKVVDLAWEFSQKKKFIWPPGHEKPEYQKVEYKDCTECEKRKPLTAFVQGYNICKLCAKQQQVEQSIEEILDE